MTGFVGWGEASLARGCGGRVAGEDLGSDWTCKQPWGGAQVQSRSASCGPFLPLAGVARSWPLGLPVPRAGAGL